MKRPDRLLYLTAVFLMALVLVATDLGNAVAPPKRPSDEPARRENRAQTPASEIRAGTHAILFSLPQSASDRMRISPVELVVSGVVVDQSGSVIVGARVT